MSLSRWDHIAELLEVVSGMAPEERQAYLDEVCGDDDELKEEILTLVASEADSNVYIERLDELVLQPVLSEALSNYDHFIEKQLGPYKLEQRIGQGGMGYVYLARRVDEAFDQQVAVKVMRQDLNPSLRSRFFRERQILANLTHRGIAQIYDGGVMEEGLPWLAMEYVDGKPITEYADEKKLTIYERLRLFRDVCEVVLYAHRNLVIHKDLKPSNIFVTEDGSVKLLDFGVARLIEVDEEELITQLDERAITPEYAAPEQIKGEPVSISTDIYALGILLYELLAGRRPFSTKGRNRHEAQRIILEEDPARLSTTLTKEEKGNSSTSVTASVISERRQENVESLRKRLIGDLDIIVLKALRKEPEERYSTVETFSEDIRRYLEGWPIKARPSTLHYRLNRYVRRNRWQVVAAALVLLSLIGGLAVSIWQSQIARAESERAQIEYEHADAVTQFMIDLFHTASPNDQALGVLTIDDLLSHGRSKAEATLADNPRLLGHVLNILGIIYVGKTQYAEAQPILEQALEIREQTHGRYSLEASEAYMMLGTLHLRLQNLPLADSLVSEALEIADTVLEPTDNHRLGTYNILGAIRNTRMMFDSADSLLQVAVDGYRINGDTLTSSFAVALNTIARIRHGKGEYEQADQLYGDALRIMTHLMGEEHPTVGLVRINYASTLFELGQLDEAEALVTGPLSMLEALYGLAVPQTIVGNMLLADIAIERGDVASAADRLTSLHARLQQTGASEAQFEPINRRLTDLGE